MSNWFYLAPGTWTKYNPKAMRNNRLVSLVKGEDRSSNISRALELIKRDLGAINDKKRILIKPNLLSSDDPRGNTNVETVRSIIEFLARNYDNFAEKEIVVFEGSAGAFYGGTTTREVFEKFGYADLEKEFKNVRLECIEDFSECVPVQIYTLGGVATIGIVRHVVEDFDYRISVNLPKTHNYAVATLGIKNMVGVVKQCDKSMIHGLKAASSNGNGSRTIFDYVPTWAISLLRRHAMGFVDLVIGYIPSYRRGIKLIHKNIVTMVKEVWPDLVVLDGLYGMEGKGPGEGNLVRMNLAIASTDPVKADALGARVMGINPEDIGYLYYLHEEGLGDMSLEGLVGVGLEQAAMHFKMHPTYNVQIQWR
ncbi:MAG: hypothetical protein A3G17_09140 [Planctomycetes bacterium RIFCSPLOWO2_12_FULL_50_35]|nr:MAG: hypothetical protein A3I59_04835 [Planctomycetes bacterium RIFCSPLOWO2_02_FULL_50_16]OHC03938.1 MAG: hypothetical protein A3G17_09140 [Planctomycetes bacterium RIFCSPLOWO2_12_FULL_50_35]HCN19833.1 hypothetical protein [Planctomycetia bacterium]